MVALSAVYLDDLGRVRLTASALAANVRYRLQHSLDNVTWEDVRGGSNVSTVGVTIVDDYEYTPNVVNYYRLLTPAFYDSFNRTTVSSNTWGTADTGQVYTNFEQDAGSFAFVQDGVGIIGDPTPITDIIEMTAPTDAAAVDAEVTWSAIQPDSNLDSPVEYDLGIRGTDGLNYYEGQIVFGTAAGGRLVSINMGTFVAGVRTGLGVLLSVGTWSAGVPWFGRFRVQGSSLSIRAWEFGTDEPNDWQVFATDTGHPIGSGMHVRSRKTSGAAYEQHFGPIEIQAIPALVGATAQVTPAQADVWLKSVAYPLFNQQIECTDWDAITRDSRAGLYDIKGRHEILAITDVGSSGSFNLTFVSRSEAENAAILGLLTYGGVLFLQPPGDTEEDCPVDYSGIPYGYVVPSGSVQPHSLRGQPIWVWEIAFTQVAAMDTSGVVPTTITWTMLWAILGPEGTWTDLWALWSTWEELWLTAGNPEDFS
jgi:hypothetical protein